MNIVLLQTRLNETEIAPLLLEFPQYLFLTFTETTYQKLGKEDWSHVEILYGNHLTPEDLRLASSLRWIHSPTPDLIPLCLQEVKNRGNVIISSTKEPNVIQMGEFVLATLLAFSKSLFEWKEANNNPSLLWSSNVREGMRTLNQSILLQIGLGAVGTEVARVAQFMGMQVRGVKKESTFHPYCQQVWGRNQLLELLPSADVVCVTPPRGEKRECWLGRKEINAMKKGAILVVVGSKESIDEEALFARAEEKAFRGILIDSSYREPIQASSILWKIPHLMITPEVAPCPKVNVEESLRLFRYNFRQYLLGNYSEMTNVILP